MSEQTVTSSLGQARALELHPPRKHAERRRPRSDVLRVGAQLTLDVASLLVAALAVSAETPSPRPWLLALGAATVVWGFAAGRLYATRIRPRLGAEVRHILVVTALVTMAVAAVELAWGRAGVGDAAIRLWVLAAALTAAARVCLQAAEQVSRRARPRPDGATLIVGAGRVGHLAAERLLSEPQLGLRPIGFLDKEPLDTESGLPVLGASWDLEDVVERHDVQQVLIAFSTAPSHVVLDLVRRCWRIGVSVMVIPRLYEVEGRRTRTEHLGALPVVSLHPSDPRGWQFALKYAVDRIVATAAMVVLAPFLGLVALAVLASSGRPVFFRQRRVGRDGQVFEMLKFRTMSGDPALSGEQDASWAASVLGSAQAAGRPRLAPADRVTRVGALLRKFSIDELPQVWNVVRGEMSLIGPRPERDHYVERFEDAIYRYPDRHRVKSGLTGWAQVNGLRGETSLADRIEWDNFYIENWSLWLDVRIMFRTMPALLGRGGEPNVSPAEAPLE
jgi:exopolysaccharide biosynthesis polyprenyl glycosylphosphotransferase